MRYYRYSIRIRSTHSDSLTLASRLRRPGGHRVLDSYINEIVAFAGTQELTELLQTSKGSQRRDFGSYLKSASARSDESASPFKATWLE